MRRKSIYRKPIERRFQQAMLDLREKHGWNAKEIAHHYHLPYRSVAGWLKGRNCPWGDRLRTLCRKFDWPYDQLFSRQAIKDDEFEHRYLDFAVLNTQYLNLNSRKPLEAYNYIALAAAMVFNYFSAHGNLECRLILDIAEGAHVRFHHPRLDGYWVKVEALHGSGLMVSLYLHQVCQMDDRKSLTKSALDFIVQSLQTAIQS